MMSNEAKILAKFDAIRPSFLDMLGCKFVAFNFETGELTMDFDVGLDLCHSGNIVQGGFVAAMLDATMSHAVFAAYSDIYALGTLEIKVMYMLPALQGKFRCIARADRTGGSITFLSGELYNDNNVCVCSATSTAKISRKQNLSE